jgi:cytochrome b561
LSKKRRPERWDTLLIALHWLAAATIVALIALGWLMVYGGLTAAATFDAYQLHKSLGFAVLALTAARLIARLIVAAPPAPAAPRWERALAAFTQGALYVLTLGAILAGWILVSASPLPIPTRFFNLFVIPNIARPGPSLFAAAKLAHKLSACAIAGLVALHTAGALKHHVLDRDDVLTRMLPRQPRPSSPRGKAAAQ